MAPSLQGRLEETTDEKVSDATQTAFATPLSVTSSMRVWFGLLSGAASLLLAAWTFLLFFAVIAIFALDFMAKNVKKECSCRSKTSLLVLV